MLTGCFYKNLPAFVYSAHENVILEEADKAACHKDKGRPVDMMEFERRCWAEVDLGALRHNFKLVRERAGDAAVMAVVKADAYGHGDAVVAPLLEQEGADQFAVSGFGGEMPALGGRYEAFILILGYTGVQNAAALAVGGISQTVFSLE